MRKAQFAMEYMLVIGFSLVIIVPVIALLYSEYDQNRTSVRVEHLTELSRELAFQAERAYHQGVPTRTRLEAYIPPGVVSMNITNTSVEFYLESTTVSVYADSRVVLVPKNFTRPFSGPHVFVLQAEYDADNKVLVNISDPDMTPDT